ncbi:MAG: serine/threonine-protein kinase [Gemmataceae bacterium]
MSADRNLLFGMLALHNGLVSRDQLLEAMTAWMAQKETPLGDILRERGGLTEDDHRLLDGLVARQIQRHGDAVKGLASLRIDSSVQHELSQLGDAEVQASVALVSPSLPGPGPTGPPVGIGQPAIRYRRLRPHARGGLGEVSVALDEELRREVALKEIQERFADFPESRARFVREAEITGHLEHPSVVPLYGLGTYPNGRPYYAMRFVRGESMQDAIAKFHKADGDPQRGRGERSLALRELLDRLLALCQAVSYAHARGVVHRDIKPANVMLGEFGETLLVDWGLARVQGPLEGSSSVSVPPIPDGLGHGSDPTRMGRVVGTPAFMPPEQANGQLDRLGPASDVFSLGATLYCLLTGQPPYSGDDALGQARRAEVFPARWRKASVPASLEAVCQKAMSAEPAGRYATAKALADDVRHWLADEPVSAYREPLAVRAARWARRHRTFVATAVTGLAVFSVASAVGLTVVGGLNQKLEAANESLTASLAETKKEREIATAVNDFLLSDLLGQADIRKQMLGDPKKERNPNITVAELLDKAAKNIEGKFTGQEETEATIRRVIGDTYRALGKYDLALPHLERSAALFGRRSLADHPGTLRSKHTLALLYRDQGRYDQAEPLLLEVVQHQEKRLGADHPETLTGKNNLALLYRDQGRYDKAEPLLLEVLQRLEKKLGADHPDTLTGKNNLALLYHDQARYDKAEPLYWEVIRQREKKLGADHPHTVNSKNNLAVLYRHQGRHDKAEPLYLEVLQQRERKLGADHPDTLTGKNNLALLYQDQERYDKAEPLLLSAVDGATTKLGPGHPNTQSFIDHLASVYELWDKPEKAEPLLRQLLDLAQRKAGADSPLLAARKALLGSNLLASKKPAEAEPLLRDSLLIRQKAQPDHWTTFNTQSALGEALSGQKKYADAEPLLVQGYAGLKQRQGKIPPQYRAVRLREALERLIGLYDATGKKDEAAKYRQEIAALTKAAKGPAK